MLVMSLDSPMVSHYYLVSNLWPVLDPLRDIGIHNFSDLDIDLSRSLRSNGIILKLDSPYMFCY